MNQPFPCPSLEVWPVALSAQQSVITSAEKILSHDEIARANRFLLPRSRDRFILGRSVLRILLAHYLNTDASAIVFSYNNHGKPAIRKPVSDMCFNLSHSGGIAVLAFGWQCRLGVDIQQEREISDHLQIAARFFAPEEVLDLGTTSGLEQRHLFFECWARKEAYIKAVGGALSIPLKDFRVRFLPGEAPAVEMPGLDRDIAQYWSMHQLNVAAGYAAALVHDGEPRSVQIKPWIDIAEALRRWGGPPDLATC